MSFLQNWSGENVIKIPVDVSLPAGTYQVSITQGVRRSNQLSFTIAEGSEVVQVPTLGGKILSEPRNDLAPRINSFEPVLVAGRRSIIRGERFTPPIVVRIEGNSGDVTWARRVTPTSEGTVEFVVPNTHFGSLVLAVDNGFGIARVQVQVVSSPAPAEQPSPGARTHPEVLSFKFIDMGLFGPMRCTVVLDAPMTGNNFLLFVRREDVEPDQSKTLKSELILMLGQEPNPDFLANIERDIARFQAAGGTLHTPYVERGINLLQQGRTYLLSFTVPQSFAAHGAEWLNAAEFHDENGFVTGNPKNIRYDMD
ncbi:MAG: hypothetical protein EXS51_01690 [Candidatus Taylorbacteria bacterium]|nr:hypothetical protein [Candidatus Taylorbacteria bacterium]